MFYHKINELKKHWNHILLIIHSLTLPFLYYLLTMLKNISANTDNPYIKKIEHDRYMNHIFKWIENLNNHASNQNCITLYTNRNNKIRKQSIANRLNFESISTTLTHMSYKLIWKYKPSPKCALERILPPNAELHHSHISLVHSDQQ